MNYGRRRISRALFLSRFRRTRGNLYQYGAYKRRRFIRPSGRFPVYRSATRYVSRPLGNPIAITERKYHDVELTTTNLALVNNDWTAALVDPQGPNPSGPGTISAFSFNAITVGTSWQQRIGRKIQIVSLKLKLEIGTVIGNETPAVPNFAQLCRVVLYLDKQTNGTAASNPADLLFSGPSNITGIHYFQNGSSFGRYKILFDRKYTMQVNSFYNYNSNQTMFNGVNKNLDITYNFNPPLTVHYNQSLTGTNSDIIDNSIHLAIGTDNSTPSGYCNYKARVTFFDA